MTEEQYINSGLSYELNRRYSSSAYHAISGKHDFGETTSEIINSANKGNIAAQFTLGIRYLMGWNAIQSEHEAIKWLTEAANFGNSLAMYTLGAISENRGGKTHDYEKAALWYKFSSEKGCTSGAASLGRLYENGFGVIRNLEEAERLYRLATSGTGHGFAEESLAKIYFEWAQNADEGTEEAARWYSMAAIRHHSEAQLSLAIIYETGRGVNKNKIEAIKWYRLAADSGNIAARYNLGRAYSEGEGVAQSLVVAYALFYSLSQNEPSPLNIIGRNIDNLNTLLTESQKSDAIILSKSISEKYCLISSIDDYLTTENSCHLSKIDSVKPVKIITKPTEPNFSDYEISRLEETIAFLSIFPEDELEQKFPIVILEFEQLFTSLASTYDKFDARGKMMERAAQSIRELAEEINNSSSTNIINNWRQVAVAATSLQHKNIKSYAKWLRSNKVRYWLTPNSNDSPSSEDL